MKSPSSSDADEAKKSVISDTDLQTCKSPVTPTTDSIFTLTSGSRHVGSPCSPALRSVTEIGRSCISTLSTRLRRQALASAVSRRPPTARTSTPLKFKEVFGRPNVAYVQLMLYNISERPMHYKLKSDWIERMKAHPSGSGEIPPGSSSRCVLVWFRESFVSDWRTARPPALVLITKFIDGPPNVAIKDITVTHLTATIDPSKQPTERPPIEQLLIDKATPVQLDQSEEAHTVARTAITPGTDNKMHVVGIREVQASERPLLEEILQPLTENHWSNAAAIFWAFTVLLLILWLFRK